MAPTSFGKEQRWDKQVLEVIRFLEAEDLTEDPSRARKIVMQASLFCLVDCVLYYIDPKCSHNRRVVNSSSFEKADPNREPSFCERNIVLRENHCSEMGGHFPGEMFIHSLVRHWWWEGMYSDAEKFVPSVQLLQGEAELVSTPLHPIPVSRPFQIVGVDIMYLPNTSNWNNM